MKNLVWVVYDGIENSVFQSQVLVPLTERLKEEPNMHATLVSFEKSRSISERLHTLMSIHKRLMVVILRKIPFVTTLSLTAAGQQLEKFFNKIPLDEVIVRGPFAGYVALHALQKSKHKQGVFPSLIIQARGLCAEEYRYAQQDKKQLFFKKWWHTFRYRQLQTLEKKVFRSQTYKRYPGTMKIEVVSVALKKYLIDHFQADESCFTIAQRDIPRHMSKKQIMKWKGDVRNELAIAPQARVYCYSGSFKPWQCVEETIVFFKTKLQKDKQSFLLILSRDRDAFVRALNQHNIPPHCYQVHAVQPSNLLHYLAAADYGLLFRRPDVVNWVSRPTKMLEYQSVDLPILHNNTIACLAEQDKKIGNMFKERMSTGA